MASGQVTVSQKIWQYLLVNMVSLWHILLTGDLHGVLYLPDLTTLRYLEYSKHLKFLSQYCSHFIGKGAS